MKMAEEEKERAGWESRASFRLCRAGDLEEVNKIEQESFKTPWTRGMFERELSLEFSYHMVAELKSGGIGGYVFCWRAGPDANVMTLAVRPDLRRQGLGRWILEQTLDALKTSGIKGVWLEVRPGNLAARALYRSFGFEEVGIRPKYYYDTGEDAIVMKKELGT